MNTPLLTVAEAAARYALFALIGAGVAGAQTAPAIQTRPPGTTPQEPQKLEKFVVTGSLLPAAAGAPANPVTVIGAPEIELTGVNADLLQVLKKSEPYFYGANNLGSDNGNIQSGSTNGGSQVALRNRSTLVLINGRRVAVHPVVASGGNSFVDVSMIPVGAIDRVEILTDGASATYGSDAVSGVVNIILKSNYQGAEVGGRYGWSPNEGKYAERSYFGVFGASAGDTSVTLSAEWKKSDPLIQWEREFGRNQFRTPSFAGSVNIAGTTNFYHLNPSMNAPASNLNLTPAQAVTQGIYEGPLTQGEVSQFFDLAQYPTMLLAAERRSLVGAIEHRLTDTMSAFADFIYTVNDTQSILNAQPVSGNVAADNPNNPFNVTVTARNRFVTFPRIYNTETTGQRGVVGLIGRIGNTSWNYEAAGNFNRSVSRFRNGNLIDAAAYTAAVASGTYNPFARTQTPGVVEGMLGQSFRNYTSELNGFDVRFNGELFQLQAGPVQAGFGAEARWESLTFTNDRGDQTGGWLQATPRQPFSARSTTDALFAELRVPIFAEGNRIPFFHRLDTSLAARKDYYSVTSDPLVPKYTMRWMPFNDEFGIRATYSESFSAPTLYDLLGPISAGFTSSVNITRYNASGASLGTTTGPRQYRSRSGSNPRLDPAESRNWTAGIVWSPRAVRGLEVSADWFSIDERDIVDTIPSSLLVQSVEQLGPASPYASLVRFGTSLAGEVHFDTGSGVTAPGQMSSRPSDEVWITNQLLNISGTWQQGLDLRVAYSYDAGSLGRFNARATGVYLHEYVRQQLPSTAPIDYVDAYNDLAPKGVFPRYRTFTQLAWALRGMTAGLSHTFIPSLDDIAWPTPYRVRRYHSFDAHVGYNFPDSANRWLRGSSITVGVNNVFNRLPPLIQSEGNQSHDINSYDPIGRFIWVSARYKF